MAKDKKSFILYCDLIHTFEHLSNEQRGEVIYWIMQYVNDLNPEPLNGLLQAVIEPIKRQLKRDLKVYENKIEKRKEAGKKGAKARWQNIANDSKRIKPIAKMAVTVTDTVTDTVTVTDNEILIDVDVIEKNYTNDKNLINAVCKSQKITEKVLLSRLKEFTLHLKSQGRNKEKDLEYKRYFLNWLRTKQKTKGIKPSQQSKRYNVI